MPGAPSPILDPWAPAQYVFGSAGAAGAVRSPDPAYAMNTEPATYDGTLHYKLGATIVLALITVFVLQASGFRFVAAVGVGAR